MSPCWGSFRKTCNIYTSGCSFVVYGGDALISHCIWSAGYGMTQPIQSYFKPHVQMFDLGRWERRPLMNLLVDATEGNCNELCQAQVSTDPYYVLLHAPSRDQVMSYTCHHSFMENSMPVALLFCASLHGIPQPVSSQLQSEPAGRADCVQHVLSVKVSHSMQQETASQTLLSCAFCPSELQLEACLSKCAAGRASCCCLQAKWQVSKHIRSRYFNNLDATEAYIKGISHLHDTYLIRVGHPLCAETKQPPCGLYS